MSERRKPFLKALIAAALASSLVAAIGATLSQVGPWYWGLTKPSWTPPDFAFGIIWTLVFGLITISGAYALSTAPDYASRNRVVTAFAFNGFLNIVWSLLFFRMQRPDWALIEVVPFWLSIVALLWLTVRHTRIGAVLLIPYLVWVSVAAFLNWEVVRLNGPFGG